MKLEDKLIKIREHFYSTNMSNKDFYNTFHEMYGYKSWNSLRKLMQSNGILTSTRSAQELNRIIPPVVANYNLETLDNFGIQESIGKEYVSAKLPPHLKKIGILSDIHFPYHDLTALTCAIKHLKEQEIDCLYLNGDIQDFYSISRHEKEKDMRDFKREVDMNYKLRSLLSYTIYNLMYSLG